MFSVNHYAKNRSLTVVLVLLMAFISSFALQGCGGGGSSPVALPDQDASGLFKSGTAELNSGATMLNDLRAFVYQGRIMMFSVAGHILYDGQITTITSDDYTATVDVYELGVKTQTAISVTGKVTSQSQITGTIAGTGSHSGTFTLTFDPAYNTAVPLPTDLSQPNEWEGDLISEFSRVGDAFFVDNVFIFDDGTNKTVGGTLEGDASDICAFEGAVVPDTNVNIYSYTVQMPSLGFNATHCFLMTLDSDYTGFAAVLSETATNNELLMAFTDGNQSVFGLLTLQLP
jgi:hypothetical protein